MRNRDSSDFLAIRTSGTLVCYIDRLEIMLAYLKREINYAVGCKNDKPYRPTMRARQA